MNSIVVFLSFAAIAFAGKNGESINHPAKGGQEHVNLDELRQAFDIFDKNHDNKIDADELLGILQALDIKGANPKDAPAMLKARDTNGDGFVNFDEFVVMMTVGADDEKLYGRVFDENANGKKEISVEEMVKIMTDIGIEVPPGEIKYFTEIFGGNLVNRAAFIAFMSRQPEHGSSQSVPNHASATPHTLPATSNHHSGGKHH